MNPLMKLQFQKAFLTAAEEEISSDKKMGTGRTLQAVKILGIWRAKTHWLCLQTTLSQGI